jgi:hypothetical protein
MFEGKVVMSCYEAYLFGISDIRAWSQQIGRQMNGGENLEFDPYIELLAPATSNSGLEKDSDGNFKEIMLYKVIIFLRKPNKEEFKEKYLIWINDIGTKKFLKVQMNEQPSVPFTIEEAVAECKRIK